MTNGHIYQIFKIGIVNWLLVMSKPVHYSTKQRHIADSKFVSLGWQTGPLCLVSWASWLAVNIRTGSPMSRRSCASCTAWNQRSLCHTAGTSRVSVQCGSACETSAGLTGGTSAGSTGTQMASRLCESGGAGRNYRPFWRPCHTGRTCRAFHRCEYARAASGCLRGKTFCRTRRKQTASLLSGFSDDSWRSICYGKTSHICCSWTLCGHCGLFHEVWENMQRWSPSDIFCSWKV